MRSPLALVLASSLAGLAKAHYTFPSLIINGAVTPAWQYVRQTDNHYSNAPVTDVTTSQIRCYESSTASTTSTVTVAAGSTIGFSASQAVYHPGYLDVYLAAANPANAEAQGTAWFKIFEEKPVFVSTSAGWSFPSENVQNFNFVIPKSLPSGQYLVRIEHIALHAASTFGGAQFYIACGQINVTGGGNGKPGPTVSFPGAYTGNEPGILINIYNYNTGPQTYISPGPAVWTG